MIEKLLQNNFPTLADLPALTKKISEISSVQQFSNGDVILREGQFIKVIPLLISGLVKVYKEDEEDGEVLLYYIKPGESCVMSMTALVKNETSKVKGVVEEDAEILLLPAKEVVSIAKKYPRWNDFIYDLFSQKYAELLNVITTLTFSKKDTRLLNYLKEQAELKHSSLINKTHQEIAFDLGSSREVISRILKKLENERKVKLSQGKIELM